MLDRLPLRVDRVRCLLKQHHCLRISVELRQLLLRRRLHPVRYRRWPKQVAGSSGNPAPEHHPKRHRAHQHNRRPPTRAAAPNGNYQLHGGSSAYPASHFHGDSLR